MKPSKKTLEAVLNAIASLPEEPPPTYAITEISGHGVDGTKFYWSKNGAPITIGKAPDRPMFETRAEAIEGAWQDLEAESQGLPEPVV